jgi:hypothetical protein
MRKLAWLTAPLALFLLAFGVAAQGSDDLTAEQVEVISGVDDFGQPVLTAVGQLINNSEERAYGNISLHAEAYDAEDTLIGEGIGVLVNACAVGLLPDFALQPGDAQSFSAP